MDVGTFLLCAIVYVEVGTYLLVAIVYVEVGTFVLGDIMCVEVGTFFFFRRSPWHFKVRKVFEKLIIYMYMFFVLSYWLFFVSNLHLTVIFIFA